MRSRALQLFVLSMSVSVAAACGGNANRSGEPGAQGTSGRGNPGAQNTATDNAPGQGAASKSAGTVLTGCLEKNMQTGQFELVVEGQNARRAGDANAGLQPGHERLQLVKTDDVELNQYVGKRVTLEGALGAGQPVTDAGTRSPVAGRGADPSQTRSREGDSKKMTVAAVRNVGETCRAEQR